MVATVIAVVVVAVLAVAGIMKIGKTAKGGGSCCTSGDSVIKGAVESLGYKVLSIHSA